MSLRDGLGGGPDLVRSPFTNQIGGWNILYSHDVASSRSHYAATLLRRIVPPFTASA